MNSPKLSPNELEGLRSWRKEYFEKNNSKNGLLGAYFLANI